MRLLQEVLDGLSAGAVYAALALALVLVFRSTGVVNFAQAEMATLSAYVAWSLAGSGLPVWGAVAAAVVLSMLLGAAVERFVIRRFEGGEPLLVITVTVAVLIVVAGLVHLFWGADIKQFPALFPEGVVTVGGLRMAISVLGTLAVLAVVIAALQVLFLRTRLGLALRAVADNPRSSALSGLPVGRLLMTGWALAAAVGALAACLIAPKVYLTPDMMNTILIYALAVAVLGGLDSPMGAVLAAGMIGVAENLIGNHVALIGNDLRIAVPLVLMGAVLLLRPQGLFGRREVERV